MLSLVAVAVILNADLNVPHGLVVACMDAARPDGVSPFAIATTAPAVERTP